MTPESLPSSIALKAMLLEFSVENYLSFDERVTLSMVAAPELDEPDGLLENTFAAPDGTRLLKSALVYGANASGKSNLVKAIELARRLVLGSAKESQSGEPIAVKPFSLGPADAERGSSFELVWIDGDARYRYGFSVASSRVLAESLSRSGFDQDEEVELFRRDGAGITVLDAFAEGRGIESKTRPNALFLSVVAQLNGAESQQILSWFRTRLVIASGVQDAGPMAFTLQKLRGGEWNEAILRLAREADLGITAISAVDITPEMLPPKLSDEVKKKLLSGEYRTLKARHQTFDADGKLRERPISTSMPSPKAPRSSSRSLAHCSTPSRTGPPWCSTSSMRACTRA